MFARKQEIRMASLFRASQLRSAWSPEECGVFAAHKEFELLKLLSTADKKVISSASSGIPCST